MLAVLKAPPAPPRGGEAHAARRAMLLSAHEARTLILLDGLVQQVHVNIFDLNAQ